MEGGPGGGVADPEGGGDAGEVAPVLVSAAALAVVLAVVPLVVAPGGSAVCARGAAYRAQAQANAQVSAGRGARARAPPRTGVTG
ncbi:hypothetical protein CP977_17210 [Streptomyces cinereoruber]|uniref:Uncharacterized protein n=1 Tax=Streptomyces cinereoruber TaxID=67260 RepID=A0ABX6BI55_9ACTN|nr:hypothetical protein CP977_17210 [Streptomyces cinereoruber]